MKIAETIRTVTKRQMTLKDLTQEQVAETSGLKQPVISRAIQGKMVNPEIKTIATLAAAIGLQPWELIKPPGAEATPSPTEEDLLAMLKKKNAEIQRLEAKLGADDPLVAAVLAMSPRQRRDFEIFLETKKLLKKDNAESKAKKKKDLIVPESDES